MAINSDVVGLDIGQSHITAVRLIEKGNTVHPLLVHEIGLPPGSLSPEGRVELAEFVTQALKQIWKEAKPKTKRVRVGMGGATMSIHTLYPPRLEPDELKSSVRFEVEPGLPYGAEHAVIDHAVIEDDPQSERMKVLAVATHQEVPKRLMRAIQQAGLEAKDVEPEICALPRAIQVGQDPQVMEMLLSIGMLTSSVALVKGGTVHYSQVLPVGADHFTQALIDLGYPPSEAERFKRQHSLIGPEQNDPYPRERNMLRSIADGLKEQIYQILVGGEEQPKRLVLVGGGARLDGLRAHLNTSLGLPVELAEPLPHLEVEDPELFLRQAPAYALAMHHEEGKKR